MSGPASNDHGPATRDPEADALIDQLSGALCALAIGDAIAADTAGRAPDAAAALVTAALDGTGTDKPALIHGAATTWAAATLHAMLRRRAERPLTGELRIALETLGAVAGGRALRGSERGMAGLLRHVAHELGRDGDARTAGIRAPRAEPIVAVLPLAFTAGDAEADVVRALVNTLWLLVHHPRTFAAAGLWLGAMRHVFESPNATLDGALDTGERLAEATLAALGARRAGALSAGLPEAGGALSTHLAIAASTGLSPFLAPAGLDDRDTPEQVVLAAIALGFESPKRILDTARARAAQGGSADIILPLGMALFGLRHGEARLPLLWLDRLASRGSLRALAEALLGQRPARLHPLLSDELALTALAERRSSTAAEAEPEATATAPDGETQEQLSFL